VERSEARSVLPTKRGVTNGLPRPGATTRRGVTISQVTVAHRGPTARFEGWDTGSKHLPECGHIVLKSTKATKLLLNVKEEFSGRYFHISCS